MFGFGRKKELKEKGLEKAREINKLIRKGVLHKLITDSNIEMTSLEGLTIQEAINSAIPDMGYYFEDSITSVKDAKLRKDLKKKQKEIFKKGEEILKSDPLLEELAIWNLFDIGLLVNAISGREIAPLLLSRSLEILENTNVDYPKERWDPWKYRGLFEEFNKKYKLKLTEADISELFLYNRTK